MDDHYNKETKKITLILNVSDVSSDTKEDRQRLYDLVNTVMCEEHAKGLINPSKEILQDD